MNPIQNGLTSDERAQIVELDSASAERKRADKWKRLANDALLVLQAFAVGHSTQTVIATALAAENAPNAHALAEERNI